MSGKPARPMIRFTPWKLVGALVILAGLIGSIFTIRLLIPDEEAPRVDVIPNGDRHYVITSLDDAVVPPLIFVLLPVWACLAVKYLPQDASENDTPRKASTLVKWIGGSVLAACGLMLVWILFLAIIWYPLKTLTRVEASRDEIVLESLYWSWTVPRKAIKDAVVEERVNRRNAKGHIELVISTAGRRFRAGGQGFQPGDPRKARYVAFLEQVRDDLAPKR